MKVIDGIDVTELIALGEGGTIEFKLASAGVHDDVFETVCSFANGCGGDMFLGHYRPKQTTHHRMTPYKASFSSKKNRYLAAA